MAVIFQFGRSSSDEFGPQFGWREQVFSGYCHYSQTTAWQPPVNIYEDEHRYYICVQLAGLEKEEIAVEVADEEIRIHGERPVPIPCEQLNPECILRIEIDSGRFFRAVRLPDHADLHSTAARLDRGFLWITVEKQTR